MDEMDEKEVLFTTEATITFDEYVRFSNRCSRFSNILSYILWIGIAGALCIMAVSSGRYPEALCIAFVCAMKVMRGPAVKREKLKASFAEEDSVGNCYLVYDFYDDCFVMTCNMVPDEPVHYCDLWSIIETKTNFYFLFDRRNGCIIMKQNCSPELIRFLHNIKEDPKGPLYKEGVKAKTDFEEEDMPELARRFGFSYETIQWDTPPDEVVRRYQRALQLASVEGYPVIFENDRRVLEVLEALDEEIDREDLLRQELPDGKELLRNWYREQNDGKELTDDDFAGELTGGQGSPQDTFIGVEVLERVFKNDDLVMLKIPVDAPWQTLAYFPIQGWEDCPEIIEIMAVGKYWYEKYRAVPAVFGCNLLEFLSEGTRIAERDAWLLAKEQITFCDQAVTIGTVSETLEELADDLTKTRTWYFMWTE